MAEHPHRELLFLCSGNYYRSRLAEELFNHFARGTGWRASSRGLAEHCPHPHNPGPMSIHARAFLSQLGLPVLEGQRPPAQATVLELETADWVIALSRSEHAPMLQARYPGVRPRRLDYWEIEDAGLSQPTTAMRALTQEVLALVATLPGSRVQSTARR